MALRELFARFTFDFDQGKLAKITQATQAAEAKVGTLGKRFDQASSSANIAKGPLASWANIAKQNGVSVAQLGAAVRGLRGRVAAAAAGDKKLAAAFAELGADTTRLTAKGRSAASVWQEVTGRLAAVESSAKRARLAMAVLGAEGKRVASPALGRGAAGLRVALRTAAPTAPVVTPKVDTAPAAAGLRRFAVLSQRVSASMSVLGVKWRSAFTGGTARVAAGELAKVGKQADAAKAKVGGLKGAFGEALSALGIFGGAFGAVFGARALKNLITEELHAADASAKLAKQLGVGVAAMQQLEAFATLGGNSVEDLRVGITTMTRNLGLMAATGEGRAKRVLKEMGVAADDLKNKKPEELFWQFGKAVASIEDPTKRSAFAQRIFGESGARMLSMFHGTAEEIEKQRKLVAELGVVWSEDFAAKAEEVNDQMHLAGLQFHRVKVSLIAELLPVLLWASGRMIRLGQAIARMAERTNAFKAAFATGGWVLFTKILGKILGGVAGVRGGLSKLMPFIGRIARMLLPWIAWTLILDDVMTFLQGGDSVLGRFLDTMFGAGTAAAVLDGIRSVLRGIVDWIRSARDTLREWLSGLDPETRKAIGTLTVFGVLGAAAFGKLTSAILLSTLKLAAHIVQLGLTAAAWAAGQASAILFSGSLTTMAGAAGAAAAAIGAVWLAVDQFRKLLAEVGGWEGLFGGVKSLLGGEGFFAGVDAEANRKAKAEAAQRLAAAAKRTGDTGEFGIRVGPEPRAPAGGKSTTTNTNTVNAPANVTVNVTAGQTPGQTGRAVAKAVTPVLTSNRQAIGAALGVYGG